MSDRTATVFNTAEEGEGPLTLIHPRTGEDVLGDRDDDDLQELCGLCHDALDQLNELRGRCFAGKRSWAAEGLFELFVGEDALHEIDEIRGGNWYSAPEW